MTRNPEIPDLIIGSGIQTWHRDWDFNLYWKYVSGYESKRFADPPAYHPLGDFQSLDFTAGYNFGDDHRFRAYLEVRNLADRAYSTVVGYPDFGRRFLVGIRHNF